MKKFVSIAVMSVLALTVALPLQAADTLEQIAKNGKIRIGYRTDAAPFSARKGKDASGYSVELCKQIVKVIKAQPGLAKVEVEYVPLGSMVQFEAVEEGRVDLLCGASTITLERREKVAFSSPIFITGVSALLRKDAPEQLRTLLISAEPDFQPELRATMKDVLHERIFVTRTGSTAEAWAEAELENYKILAKLNPADSYEQGIQQVVDGKADVMLADRPILLVAAVTNESANELMVLPRYFTIEPIALAMQRDDDEFRLLVDRALSSLVQSGEFMTIYVRFFGLPDNAAMSLFSLYGMMN
jgi:polar amino acid transport system substrate-binding protein